MTGASDDDTRRAARDAAVAGYALAIGAVRMAEERLDLMRGPYESAAHDVVLARRDRERWLERLNVVLMTGRAPA